MLSKHLNERDIRSIYPSPDSWIEILVLFKILIPLIDLTHINYSMFQTHTSTMERRDFTIFRCFYK